MKRFWLGIAMMFVVSACDSGNPWTEGEDEGPPEVVVPAELLGDLESFTYDPVAKTLIVRGLSLDQTPFEAAYTRKPALDRVGYEAYTNQQGSLDRHTTAYVKEIDGTRAAIVVSGGQFEYYFGGSQYSRSGEFDRPPIDVNGGLITYAGSYVGLSNYSGDGGDLLPVAPGTPIDLRPVQAGEITGKTFISADFADNTVNGIVYDRIVVDNPAIDLSAQNIALAPTAIEENGTFTGDATQARTNKGTYGGIFGGPDASAVAGTLYVKDHIAGFDNVEEYGLFVLSQCGTATSDPVCTQPHP